MGSAIDEFIKSNLGERTLQKIEDRLFEKYHITLSQALLDFAKLDIVLHEFFGAGAVGLEKKILEDLRLRDAFPNNE